MSPNSITWVGMDAHKNSIKVAAWLPGQAEPVEWTEDTTVEAIRRLARRLQRMAPGEVRACYEAGPTGYGLQRILEASGVICEVVAPSLTPVKPGSRIKTDRRDARKLGELLRADLLTIVHPPSETDEALRDLCRCRDDVRVDLLRARHRPAKFLLRRHLVYRQTKHHWGSRHVAWLEQLRFDDAMSQATFDSYFLAVQQLEERQRQLDQRLAEFGAQEPYREPVAALRCFKGIDTVTAVCLVAELHDFRRFRSPRQLAAPARRLRRAGAQRGLERRARAPRPHHQDRQPPRAPAADRGGLAPRHRPALSAPLRARREGQSARVLAIADRAQERLCARFRRMSEAGKVHPKTIVAMARELCGYLWAVLHPAALAIRG